MLREIKGALVLLVIFFGIAAAYEEYYPFEVATGQTKTPSENLGAPWFQDGKGPAFGNDKDFYIKYGPTNHKLNFNGTGGGYFNLGGDITFYTADPTNDTISFGNYPITAAGGITGPGGVQIKAGALKHVLKDGTAAATNVSVSGIATGDELISVVALTTKAAISTMADRTSEYSVGSGILIKAAGTNEAGNQLDIWYWDRTA